MGSTNSNRGNRLSSARWRVVSIAGRGDCLFEALAQALAMDIGAGQLSGQEAYAAGQALRREIVKHVCNHANTFSHFMTYHPGNPRLQFNNTMAPAQKAKQYCAEMREPGCWGGEIELGVAADVLGRVVKLYTKPSRANNGYVLNSAYTPSGSVNRSLHPLRLVRQDLGGRGAVEQGHYEALVPLRPNSRPFRNSPAMQTRLNNIRRRSVANSLNEDKELQRALRESVRQAALNSSRRRSATVTRRNSLNEEKELQQALWASKQQARELHERALANLAAVRRRRGL